MNSMEPNSRNVSNNIFGDNVTIYQGNTQNPVADQTDQCLKDLRLTDPRDDKTRIQQTKGGLLKESSNWIFENETFNQWRDDEQNTLLWIKGDPGKGKTMLLSAIIDELTPSTKLARPINGTNETFLSYFFCQGTDARINNATAVLRGLIYLIIIQDRSLISHVQEKYNHAGKDVFLDANAWVALSEMLLSILHDPKVADVVLIVDALDECETDSAKLLEFITRYASLPRVKWAVSSRNTLSIQQKLESFIQSGILSLELKANAETVSNAVDIYIEHKISRLRSVQHNQGQRDVISDTLRQKANGTFLWVSLVMKELEDVQSWEVTEVVKEMPTDLTAVYRRMIGQIRSQRRGNAKFCWKILATIFTAYYPLSLGELGFLAGLPKEISEHLESIIKLVTMCGSFLTIRQGIIYFIHQSAKDFLSTETFQSDFAQRHTNIYDQSTAAISTLPQNIYGLPDFGFRPENAQEPEPNPLTPMRYSCFCWIGHFCDAYGRNPKPEIGQALQEKLWSFLKDNVLRWLESIILLGGLADALRSLQKMVRELQLNADSQLSKFLHSTEKFIIKNGPVITRAPLQVYGSALLFSQTSSDMNQQQWKEHLPLIEDIKGVIKTNNALLQTLEGHHSRVTAVCFSPDGKAMASCGGSGTVRIWDAATGAIKHTITTGSQNMKAISFLPDGKSLAFVFDRDRFGHRHELSLLTVSLAHKSSSTQLYYALERKHRTDLHTKSTKFRARQSGLLFPPPASLSLGAATWKSLQQLDEDRLSSIRDTFFPPPAPLALDGAATCKSLKKLNEDQLHSTRATFSLDGKMLAMIEGVSSPIELWNASTCLLLRTFQTTKAGEGLTYVMAFSPDYKTIASGHALATVNLWNVETGTCYQTFKTSQPSITSIAFQLDGKKIVLGHATPSENIRMLDIATGRNQETHISHDEQICAIAFSPDGRTMAVGSEDGTTQLWDADSGMQPWMPEDTVGRKMRSARSKTIEKMIFSPDGKTLALSTFLSREVELWDTSKGACQNAFQVSPLIFTLKVARNRDGAITFSPDSRTLALGCCGICLWDVATGRETRHPTLWGSHCTAIVFSPNGEQLASSLSGFEIQLHNMATGEVQRRFRKGADEVHAITFLPEGKSLAAVYETGLILVWDLATGACLQEFRHEDSLRVNPALISILRYTSIKDLPDGRFLCFPHTINPFQTNRKFPKHNSLLIEGQWITMDGKDLLWLPREYRSNAVVIHGNMVAIGHKSGVTFIRFNSSAPEEV